MLQNEPISQTSQGLGQVSDSARAAVMSARNGPGMQRLTVQRESAYIDLKNSGLIKASTVINFNPLSLKVEDGHVPWRIPAGTDKNKKGIKVEHGGKTYQAAFFTVREPSFIPWIRDVNKPSAEYENADAVYDAKFILPLELVDQYRIQYTTPQFTPMGGVLVFEGDIHAFTKGETIRIPKTSRKPDGTRSYYTEESNSQKELAATLSMQKDYCTFMIQQGDEYNQSEQERKNITPVHRLWLQFALEMGWKQKSPEWMNATLDSEESCKGCGKGRTRTDAWFCGCGRPYNPFAAYMAGENVPDSYLYALKDKELDTVMKELTRREALRDRFRAAAPAAKQAKPAEAKDDAADKAK